MGAPCTSPHHTSPSLPGHGCSFTDVTPVLWALRETLEEAHVPYGSLCPGVDWTWECGSLGLMPGEGLPRHFLPQSETRHHLNHRGVTHGKRTGEGGRLCEMFRLCKKRGVNEI